MSFLVAALLGSSAGYGAYASWWTFASIATGSLVLSVLAGFLVFVITLLGIRSVLAEGQ